MRKEGLFNFIITGYIEGNVNGGKKHNLANELV